MKFILATCMYNRPKVSELFLIRYLKLKEKFDIPLVVAASDGDSINLCKRYNIEHFPYENLPLGAKNNVLFEYILKRYECDYIIHTGDDDLISLDLFSSYIETAQKKTPYFGVNSIYFYEPSSKRATRFVYNIPFKPVGAYRCFSVEMLRDHCYYGQARFRKSDVHNHYNELFTYRISRHKFDYYERMGIIGYDQRNFEFELWSTGLNKGLDNSSESRLINAGITPHLIPCETPEIIDVKSSQNIWSLDHAFNKSGHKSCEVAEVEKLLYPDEKKFIEKYLIK